MSRARRIDRSKDNPYLRGEKIQFQFEGRALEGFRNEPLAMSLLANGVEVFGRSIKYHRPRGPSCLQGHCSSCMVRVNGIPNVRSCETATRSGMVVDRQIGWPSSGRDLFRMVDWAYGKRMDHHGMFTASSFINRMAMAFIRKLAGFGQPATADPRPANTLIEKSVEVVVVGAGAAGLQATKVLANAGHQVVLLERTGLLGGRLLDMSCRLKDKRAWGLAKNIAKEIETHDGTEIHTDTPVLAVYQGDDGLEVMAAGAHKTFLLRPQRLLLANGGYCQLPLFANNDLPGILSLRAADKMLGGWGVVPAEPVVVAGESLQAQQLAIDLAEAGVKVAALICDKPADALAEAFQAMSLSIISGHRIVQARGVRVLDRIELAKPGQDVADLIIDCRLLAAEAPETPAYELGHHAGCRVDFRSATGHTLVCNARGQSSDGQIFAAGHCAGARNATQATMQGQVAGLACAISIKDRSELSQNLDKLLADQG